MSSSYTLEALLQQEDELQFDYFNNDLAWQLGCKLKEIAEQKNRHVAIEIYAFKQTLFSFAMANTQLDNQLWIKRKRRTVLRFGNSSYYINQYNKSKNRVFEEQDHIDAKQYAGHGGAFPIRIRNSGLVGVVTVSGLPQIEDHQMVIEALAAFTV